MMGVRIHVESYDTVRVIREYRVVCGLCGVIDYDESLAKANMAAATHENQHQGAKK